MLQAVVPYPLPTRTSLTSFLESLRLRRHVEASQRQRLRRRVARWKERSKQRVWLVCAALFGPGDDNDKLPSTPPQQLTSARDDNDNKNNNTSSSGRSSQASTLCDLSDLADIMTSFDDDDEIEDEEEDDGGDEQQDLSDSEADNQSPPTFSKRSSRFGFRDRLRRSLSSNLRSSRHLPLERSTLERRIESVVHRTLRDASTFEGQVCLRFLEKQRSFRLTTAVAGRFYLGQVRGVIGDLVAFLMTYRRDVLAMDRGDQQLAQNNNNDDDDSDAITFAVRCAVEQYVCESLQDELRQWAAMATPSVVHPRRSHKQLHKWSALPATSAEFGLPRSVARAVEGDATVAMAIASLRDIGQHTAPSRKMQSLVDACHALSAFLAAPSNSPAGCTSSSVSSVDADAFLPLLIFAVARSDMRDALLQPMLLTELFPFTTQHGERPYYLTMLDASLQYIQSQS
ncbi:hypothetical protein PINS_up022191 [Pythium insidiosum]|nr:hypothetical protein PINS_up022191 [Pythium insidiosum]